MVEVGSVVTFIIIAVFYEIRENKKREKLYKQLTCVQQEIEKWEKMVGKRCD